MKATNNNMFGTNNNIIIEVLVLRPIDEGHGGGAEGHEGVRNPEEEEGHQEGEDHAGHE